MDFHTNYIFNSYWHCSCGEKVLHSKIKSIEPHKVDGQYCYVKVEIVQEGDTITKKEILEC